MKRRTPYQAVGSTPCRRNNVTELVDVVAAGVEAETVDLAVAVERGEGLTPVPVEARTDRERAPVLGDDRDQAARAGQRAERRGERLRVVEVHQDAVAQHAVEPRLAEELHRALTVGFDEVDPRRDRARLLLERAAGLGQHHGRTGRRW